MNLNKADLLRYVTIRISYTICLQAVYKQCGPRIFVPIQRAEAISAYRR